MTGFGGDGIPGTYIVPPDPANTSRIVPSAYHGCVQDGPFTDYTIKLGPGFLVTEHCLTRGIDNSFYIHLTSSFITHVMNFSTYNEFRVELEGYVNPALYFGPHMAGHISVGGEMSNFFSSPSGQ